MTAGLEAALRHDRRVTAAGLALLTMLSWAYMLVLGGDMDPGMRTDGGASMSAAMSSSFRAWTATDGLMMFLMWAIMMVAMMTPSAAPMILLHARVQRQNTGASPHPATWAFTAGYLAVWTAFSALATTLQWALEQGALLSPMMVSTSRWLGAALLLAAGAYQVSSLKESCLRHCRSPLHFVSQHWRTGVGGAFRMGVHHGAYCVGCCWVLMALLFVGGVMNLLWVGLIAGFVLLEKVASRPRLIARVSGALLILAGVVLPWRP